jgi:cell division septation protein DedD
MTEQAARRDSAAAGRETSRTVTPPAPPARRSGWYVQVSAVRTRAAGDQELRRLARVDYPGVILQEGGLYKVRAGPFATRQEAASALTKIKAHLGGTPFVTRVP